MALLIYKQWHRPPNRKNTPGSNAAHIKYIGKRPGVMLNEGSDNGLFGKINNCFTTDINMDLIMGYTGILSRQGKTIFRSVISLKPDDEIGLGYKLETKEQFENFAKYHANTIARNNGINFKDFEYVAAAHKNLETGDNHLHFIFWDKNQDVSQNFVNPEIGNAIRLEIENEESSILEAEESAAEDLFGEVTDEDILKKNGYIIDNKEGNKTREWLIKKAYESELKVLYDEKNDAIKNIPETAESIINKITYSTNKYTPSEFMRRFKALEKNRPKTGRNVYGFMSSDYKKELDTFTDYLIENFPEISTEVNRLLAYNDIYSSIMYSKESNYGKYTSAEKLGKVWDSIYNKIGNKVLAELFKYNKEHENDDKYTDIALSLTQMIFQSLKRANDNYDTAFSESNVFGKGDLSENELKDLIYKNKDKGYER